jgi:hypothetical protein
VDGFVKDGAHPFAWFHRGELLDSAGPVRMGKECPCKDAGAGTDSAEAETLIKDVISENARHILDDIDRVRSLSGYFLADILESFGRVRWASSEERG